MYKLLLIALIVHVAFAADSNEFHSQKLDREWSSDIKYEKNDDWLNTFQSGRSDQFYEGIFRTRIDHFRPLNQQRVDFLYHVNANHFIAGGPLYIYLKDTFDSSTRWIEGGLMADIARETGAALLTFDQRYFGQNRPFDSASLEDLELLTVEQALADIATFIRFVRPSDNTRIILYGSGTGATLAVFARSRYPHLVSAVWSSSAILESSVYSFGPFDTFSYTFNINDDGQCHDIIRNAYDIIAYLVINGEGEYLADRMNLCQALDTNSASDVAALYENSIRAILYYLNEFHYNGVRAFCNDLLAIPGDSLNSFARWLRYVYGDEECFDSSYATLINVTSNTEWDQPGTNTGRRQSYFLQCTQIGGFLVADEYTWLPGTVNFAYHLQKCEDMFGRPFEYGLIADAFYALRNEYDQALLNVIYTNGLLDPMRYFGRIYDASYSGVVINIDHTLKSADLASISVNDHESLFEAKTVIIDYITRWSNATVNLN